MYRTIFIVLLCVAKSYSTVNLGQLNESRSGDCQLVGQAAELASESAYSLPYARRIIHCYYSAISPVPILPPHGGRKAD